MVLLKVSTCGAVPSGPIAYTTSVPVAGSRPETSSADSFWVSAHPAGYPTPRSGTYSLAWPACTRMTDASFEPDDAAVSTTYTSPLAVTARPLGATKPFD